MALILAIEPDTRQSAQLSALVRAELGAELVHRPTAPEGVVALEGRIPDLILTSSLISPREDAVLAAHLRELGGAAGHVQTVTIPVLGTAAPQRARGMLAALRREKPQPVMTDGCDPTVFAEQVRQYLVTAEEQKAHPPARRPAEAAIAAVFDTGEAPAPIEEATTVFESQTDASYDAYAVKDAAVPVDPYHPAPAWPEDAADATEVHVDARTAAVDEPPFVEIAPAPHIKADAAIEAVAPALAPFESTVEPLSLELLQDAGEDRTAVPTLELPVDIVVAPDQLVALVEPGDAEPDVRARAAFREVRVDPMAAQALEELSRLAPAPSLHDGIGAEPPVPVVEMRSFQSLDDIANELAAGPRRQPAFESLDDLASLFAAKPAPPRRRQAEADMYTGPAPEIEFSAPVRDESRLIESLFAAPSAPAEEEASSLVLGIDPSLFATPPPRTRASRPQPSAWEPEPVAAAPLPTLAEPVFVEPVFAEPVFVEAAIVDDIMSAEAASVAAPVAEEPAISFAVEPTPTETATLDVAAAEQEPVQALAVVDTVMDAAPEAAAEPVMAPVIEAAVEEPPVAVLEIAARDVAAPDVAAPAWELERFGPTATESAATIGDSLGDQLDRAAAMQTAAPGAATTPFANFDPFEEFVVDFTIVDEPDPMAVATAPPEAMPNRVVAAAAPAPFTFTFVSDFGDELADFVNQPEETITLSGPVLDDEALSLIGDAALKASLDALVIEEFGGKRLVRKSTPKSHAGATQVAPADRKSRKRPVQDEWGMFDPEQCGFAALEDEDKGDGGSPAGQVRVITY